MIDTAGRRSIRSSRSGVRSWRIVANERTGTNAPLSFRTLIRSNVSISMPRRESTSTQIGRVRPKHLTLRVRAVPKSHEQAGRRFSDGEPEPLDFRGERGQRNRDPVLKEFLGQVNVGAGREAHFQPVRAVAAASRAQLSQVLDAIDLGFKRAASFSSATAAVAPG